MCRCVLFRNGRNLEAYRAATIYVDDRSNIARLRYLLNVFEGLIENTEFVAASISPAVVFNITVQARSWHFDARRLLAEDLSDYKAYVAHSAFQRDLMRNELRSVHHPKRTQHDHGIVCSFLASRSPSGMAKHYQSPDGNAGVQKYV